MMTDSTTLLKLLGEKCKPDYLYRQLAEECTELAQAALKKVRYMKHEMPLSQKGGVDANYIEELADVRVMSWLAEQALKPQEREAMFRITRFKRECMAHRLRAKRPESKPCDCFAAAPPADEFRKWAKFWGAFWDAINEQLEHVKEAEQ